MVDQVFGDQHVHHRVVKCDVRTRVNLREMRGKVDQVMATDVDDDQLGPIFDRFFHESRRDGMIGACM